MKKMMMFLVLLSAGCYEQYWHKAQDKCIKLCRISEPYHGMLIACDKHKKCECVCIPVTQHGGEQLY